ncbi:hypothetical protein QCA50_020858 [Cerrena zonata]|uniref:Uncharacterized protein n=1 Tax=Cerrena zonata TaxID=2478898 RepID=A0AAW0FAU6_9APHY
MFVLRNPGKIHLMLLVDSWHEDLLKHNPFGGSNRKNENKRTFKNVLEFLDTKTGIALWFKGSKYLRARLQEQVTASILSYNEIIGSDIHNIPVSVISSDFMIKNSLNWGKWQRDLT